MKVGAGTSVEGGAAWGRDAGAWGQGQRTWVLPAGVGQRNEDARKGGARICAHAGQLLLVQQPPPSAEEKISGTEGGTPSRRGRTNRGDTAGCSPSPKLLAAPAASGPGALTSPLPPCCGR